MNDKSVDAVVMRISLRTTRAAAEAERLRPVVEQRRAAEQMIVSARMLGAGLQAHTVARKGAEPRVIDAIALEVGADGDERIERSDVTVLFDRSANAVFRLADDGKIDEAGARAALRFAWAGDRVMGAVRVRTSAFERVARSASDGLIAAEADAQARADWDVARVALMRAEFRIMDGVMRRDEGAAEAAASAFPSISHRQTLTGMAYAALINACERLAGLYGYAPQRRP